MTKGFFSAPGSARSRCIYGNSTRRADAFQFTFDLKGKRELPTVSNINKRFLSRLFASDPFLNRMSVELRGEKAAK